MPRKYIVTAINILNSFFFNIIEWVCIFSRKFTLHSTHLENLMLFSQNNPLIQATGQCVLPRCQMFPEAKLNDKWNGIEEGKVELGRRDKLNSPPPSPSLSALLPPCLNHHHLYNLSQINYILSHLIRTFLLFKEFNSSPLFKFLWKTLNPLNPKNKKIYIQNHSDT